MLHGIFLTAKISKFPNTTSLLFKNNQLSNLFATKKIDSFIDFTKYNSEKSLHKSKKIPIFALILSTLGIIMSKTADY